MSPSEFDLRHALHDGEGSGVNADLIILHARARAAQRRTRLLSTAAIVGIVAGLGVGIGFLATNSNNEKASSSAIAGGSSAYGTEHGPNHGSANGAAGSQPAPRVPLPAAAAPTAQRNDRAADAPASACPKTMPHYLLPGGGSPEQFGAGGPLFRAAVSSVVVCGYGSAEEQSTTKATTAQPGRLLLTGADADRLVTSLEHASKTPVLLFCPAIRQVNDLALIGVSANGRSVGTVTAALNNAACDVRVTNGTAIRYNWQPPAELRARLLALQPR